MAFKLPARAPAPASGSRTSAMSVLFFLVPLALLAVTGAVLAFTWAVRDGQFDDLQTPALRAVLDEDNEANP